MNIGLIDIDSHNFPNLVLMKLSAYYKEQGYNVSLLAPDDVLSGTSLFDNYDNLIGACVFSWSKYIAERLQSIGVYVGGTGTNNKDVLPFDIEHMTPDYSLYGITNTAYGFLTRGCPRHCPFCIVGDKEGLTSRKVADLSEFWNGQKNIEILDPNLLACTDWENLLTQLIDSKATVNINQGMDARLLTKEKIEIINHIKIKAIHFAWDNPRDKFAMAGLNLFAKYNDWEFRKRKVYVLTNYWSTFEEDLMRVYWLREHGFDPYIMIFNKQSAPRKIKLLARWVNNKFIFRKCERFEDYDEKKG